MTLAVCWQGLFALPGLVAMCAGPSNHTPIGTRNSVPKAAMVFQISAKTIAGFGTAILLARARSSYSGASAGLVVTAGWVGNGGVLLRACVRTGGVQGSGASQHWPAPVRWGSDG
eukprot:COSAG01_NODE_2208_length_8166_cov_2.677823_6_plen_115_part_00